MRRSALFAGAMLAFGMGNGSVFQLVPQRFRHEIGVMTGLVGMTGGVGGFFLASSLGLSKQLTGHYQAGLSDVRLAGGAGAGRAHQHQASLAHDLGRDRHRGRTHLAVAAHTPGDNRAFGLTHDTSCPDRLEPQRQTHRRPRDARARGIQRLARTPRRRGAALSARHDLRHAAQRGGARVRRASSPTAASTISCSSRAKASRASCAASTNTTRRCGRVSSQGLRKLRTITRGPKPARALRALGLKPSIEATEPTTDGVIRSLSAAPARRPPHRRAALRQRSEPHAHAFPARARRGTSPPSRHTSMATPPTMRP